MLPFSMDCFSMIRKIIILVGIWNTLTTFCIHVFTFYSLKLNKVNVIHRRTLVSLLYGLQELFCAFILALNLTSVSNIRLSVLLSSPNRYSMDILMRECNESDTFHESTFLFVMSSFILNLWKRKWFNRCEFLEFLSNLVHISFFWSGYYARYFGIIFFVSSNHVIRRNLQVLLVNKKSVAFYASRVIFMCMWAYFFAYLVTVYALLPILFADCAKFSNRKLCNTFRSIFILYYGIEITYSPIGDFVMKCAKRVKFFWVMLPGKTCGKKSVLKDKLHLKDEEETLRMYTAQGKSIREIKKQVELMQTVKCVMTIRKKLKRKNKENSERIASKNCNDVEVESTTEVMK